MPTELLGLCSISRNKCKLGNQSCLVIWEVEADISRLLVRPAVTAPCSFGKLRIRCGICEICPAEPDPALPETYAPAWCARQDLNLRPSAPQADALSRLSYERPGGGTQ